MEKTYINGLFIKKKILSFGEVINVSIKVAEFVQQLQSHTNANGYCNIVLQNRKEDDKNGNNMYAILDTYVPVKREEIANYAVKSKVMDKEFTKITDAQFIDDDLPF